MRDFILDTTHIQATNTICFLLFILSVYLIHHHSQHQQFTDVATAMCLCLYCAAAAATHDLLDFICTGNTHIIIAFMPLNTHSYNGEKKIQK